MKQRVRGGTPDHGENLCLSCASSTVRRGHRVSEEEVFCHVFAGENSGPQRMTFAVAECGAYRNKALARPDAFYKTAWVLIPDVGYIPPDEFRQKQKKGEVT
jgi:hypothetical protein